MIRSTYNQLFAVTRSLGGVGAAGVAAAFEAVFGTGFFFGGRSFGRVCHQVELPFLFSEWEPSPKSNDNNRPLAFGQLVFLYLSADTHRVTNFSCTGYSCNDPYKGTGKDVRFDHS